MSVLKTLGDPDGLISLIEKAKVEHGTGLTISHHDNKYGTCEIAEFWFEKSEDGRVFLILN